jgi:hypothetical protein
MSVMLRPISTERARSAPMLSDESILIPADPLVKSLLCRRERRIWPRALEFESEAFLAFRRCGCALRLPAR